MINMLHAARSRLFPRPGDGSHLSCQAAQGGKGARGRARRRRPGLCCRAGSLRERHPFSFPAYRCVFLCPASIRGARSCPNVPGRLHPLFRDLTGRKGGCSCRSGVSLQRQDVLDTTEQESASDAEVGPRQGVSVVCARLGFELQVQCGGRFGEEFMGKRIWRREFLGLGAAAGGFLAGSGADGHFVDADRDGSLPFPCLHYTLDQCIRACFFFTGTNRAVRPARGECRRVCSGRIEQSAGRKLPKGADQHGRRGMPPVPRPGQAGAR
ncbi:MAG: hypothetical protein H6Q05_1072 [Acidobacteria bacterium]|nr:hypothetical protein [Acidobacteriota bacterium]